MAVFVHWLKDGHLLYFVTNARLPPLETFARLYSFAARYNIPVLMNNAVNNMHESMTSKTFKLEDLLQAINISFNSSPTLAGSAMQSKLLQFTNAHRRKLMAMKVFRDYVDGGMALSSLRDALELGTSQFKEDQSTYRWHEDAMFLT